MGAHRNKFIVLFALLSVIFYAGAFLGGYDIGKRGPKVIHSTHIVTRPTIKMNAPLSAVRANFEGSPYYSGTISELPSTFSCSGYHGSGTDPDWVAIFCTK